MKGNTELSANASIPEHRSFTKKQIKSEKQQLNTSELQQNHKKPSKGENKEVNDFLPSSPLKLLSS